MYSYHHHIGDYAAATAHLTLEEDAIYRRCLDLYYLNESALPKDLNRLSRYLRLDAKITAHISALQYVLVEFFKEDDSGYYHSRCEKEIDLYREKTKAKDCKRSNETERQQRSRANKAALFDQARALGLSVKWNAKVEDVKAQIASLGHTPVTHLSRTCHAPVTPTNTAPDTANLNLNLNLNQVNTAQEKTVESDVVTSPVTTEPEPVQDKPKRIKKPKSEVVTLPDDFGIGTGTIKEWAEKKGISAPELEMRMEHFKIKAIKLNYAYVYPRGWVAAFQDSVNNDWAKLGQAPSPRFDKPTSPQPTNDTSKGNRLGITPEQLAHSMSVAGRFNH